MRPLFSLLCLPLFLLACQHTPQQDSSTVSTGASSSPGAARPNVTPPLVSDAVRQAALESPTLERCEKPLALVAYTEPATAPWKKRLAQEHKLSSTLPLLRQLAKESNCFTVVSSQTLSTQARKGQQLAFSIKPVVVESSGEGRMAGLVGTGAGTSTVQPQFVLQNPLKRDDTTLIKAQRDLQNDSLSIDKALGTIDLSKLDNGKWIHTAEARQLLAGFVDGFNQTVRITRQIPAPPTKTTAAQ